MPDNELIMLDSLALSVVFPGKTPLERLFLGFLLANTASQLCGEYCPEQWSSRKVSESLAYMIPTAATTYSVYLPETKLTATLSADAFGLAVTSIVLARIAVLNEPNADTCRFCELREYAQQHPENGLIGSVMTMKPKEEVISSSLIHNNNNHH
ncbi:antirestriction protein [Xenorhabdus anantnagensis]|uniref:Antirestriction protein n=1 Tax=Xenorhabdus anantnagensis TaxID=3025875 RepID=A0ABT5LNY7_9GAMM|nr:antirestriction protein [Xenorhabdus anantnagensis]MDC9596109.1 antirestriction protein [Xenorhabdus anantnagensis]